MLGERRSYNHYTFHTGINLVTFMEHAASTALLLPRQTSLLLLVLLTSCSAQSTYYVTPTPDTPCPGEPCHTLSEYAADWHFQSNTTMEFLPGNHTLEQTMSVTNLTGLTLHGDSSSLPEITSRILCTSGSAGFVFREITGLHITALAFISSVPNGNGLVYAVSVQQSKISNCAFQKNTFQNNSASYSGALYVGNSIVDLTENTFQNNSALEGGALYVENSIVDLTKNTFQNNFATRGGGLFVENSNLNLTGNTFQNNSAEDRGGGLYTLDNSNVNFTWNTFRNNSAKADGGGLYVSRSNLNLTENTFQNNVAAEGGALSVFNSINELTKNTFQNNSAFGGGALHVLISVVNLTGNTFQNNSAEFLGGGIFIQYYSQVNFTGNIFQNNSAGNIGGGFYAENSNLNLSGNTFQSNSASVGGSLHVDLTSNITFTDDHFTDSYAQLGGAIFVVGNSNVRMSSVVIENSRAQYGGGIAALDSKLELLERTIIDNNTASFGGGLYAYNTEFHMNAKVINNSAKDGGGGIYASKSNFSFAENTTIINNVASTGGGMLLSGDSKLLLPSNMTLHFTSNHASKTGGAIKIEESNPLTYCLPKVANNTVSSSDCFFQSQSQMEQVYIYEFRDLINFIEDLNINHTICFDNNSAVEAGADLYGGSIDNCLVSNIIGIAQYYSGPSVSGYLFDVISSSGGESKVSISSDPLHICTCRDNLTDCTGSYDAGPVYSGGTLTIPVIAQGQRNGTTAAIVQLIPTPNDISHRNLEDSQNINNYCSSLKYTIHSRAVDTIQELTLYAEGPCSPTPTHTLTVTVDIRHCPPGFQLAVNEPTCICAERLQQFTNTCLIDSATVLRQQNDEFWVGYGNDNDNESRGLIIHPHCPFDFCTTKETYFTVDESDKQCNYNRSGLLCGRCSDNLSLALGSSRCLQCPNTYLMLLAAFAFAGIALVLFLLVLRLTVAVGTVNGLIFYANIIAVNSTIFLQPRATNVLTVFIAWLNLDLGIETCFYNGMDTYVKTWLQFLFPLYVWALIGMIILGSYYSGRVAKVFGRNPIAVLATLFLLSYAKLLRTVIAALSVTYLEYPNNLQLAVWLYDGNIRYFSGRHIPLFIGAMVCLIFLFLPYTALLVFGQWLQAKSQLNIFRCVNNRYVKPFLDAYHAPYTDKHRYWTGLMLILRLVLFLISAVNALGDPSVNLLAIGSITAVILILPIVLGSRIYKTWSLGLLETSFILNLNIFSLASLYVRSTGGNQNAVTSTSVGIAFATFIGIVIYHSAQQIKGTWLWRRLRLRHDYVSFPFTDVASGPEHPPDRMFILGSAPTQTVLDMSALREPCMATDHP